MPGEHIDLTSETVDSGHLSGSPLSRRFVGIHFACCGIYSRIYVNRDETAYTGRCPRCSRKITLRVGPGGTESRFFTAR
jgi:hypothetical protein